MFNFLGSYFGISKRSSKWPKIRKQHLEKNPVCAICGRNKKLEVHHMIPVNVDSSKELDPNNLITLCDDPCHFVFGHLFDYKSWNPNIIKDCEYFAKKIRDRP